MNTLYSVKNDGENTERAEQAADGIEGEIAVSDDGKYLLFYRQRGKALEGGQVS